MKATKFLFNLSAVICFIFGALYVFTLVFIPLGIYCFITAKRFVYKAENLIDFNVLPNNILRNYVIFASIACFPLGLISIIPYLMISSNNIKVETTEKTALSEPIVVDFEEENKETEQKVEEVEIHTEQTDEEKMAKFEKLKKFHEKGIVTDDELEMAREQLFGKEE